MTYVTVYRVVGPDNRGIYMGNGADLAGIDSRPSPMSPMPRDDGLDDMPVVTHRFGFSCPLQLRNWFSAEQRQLLHEAGAKVKVFQVSKGRVKFGGKQLTFNANKAKLLTTKQLTEV